MWGCLLGGRRVQGPRLRSVVSCQGAQLARCAARELTAWTLGAYRCVLLPVGLSPARPRHAPVVSFPAPGPLQGIPPSCRVAMVPASRVPVQCRCGHGGTWGCSSLRRFRCSHVSLMLIHLVRISHS